MDWKDHITADPAVLVGKPAIKGTRLSVEFILGLSEEGWTEQQILENYPQLTPMALRALFACVREGFSEEAFVFSGKAS